MRYRIWYFLNGEWFVVSCGKNSEYAKKILIRYYQPPSYFPYMEYIA